MRKEHFHYLSSDRLTLIHGVKWIPEGTVRAILQISHGMVEYIERYEALGIYLTSHGVLMVGNDHLGHGDSIRSEEHYGYFAEENGNIVLLKDIHKLRGNMQKEYPKTPYFFLGHSMGSFLVRQYLCSQGEGLSGAIIMGTGYQPRPLVNLGITLCRALAAKDGWMYRSTLVDNMAFGSFNKKFLPARTDKDWLSRNEKNVDAFIADDKCGFILTLNGYYNMFQGLLKLTSMEYISKMPKELPIFFMSGEADPVGDFGKGVNKIVIDFQNIGMKNVSLKLYPEDRHEILNESDWEQINEDLLKWLEAYI